MKVTELYSAISTTKRKGLGGSPAEKMSELQPLDYNILFPSPLAASEPFLKSLIAKQDYISENIKHAIMNDGTLSTVKCANGLVFDNVADFRNIPFELIDFEPKTVSENAPPAFVPIVNLKKLEANKFIPDALRIAEDAYLFTDKYNSKAPLDGNYSVLTLDQLVSTVEFYFNLARKRNQEDAESEQNSKIEQYKRFDSEKRANFYSFRVRYTDLPLKFREKVSAIQWADYSLEEKEAVMLPIKVKVKPVTTKFGKDLKSMPLSYHTMYENVIDPSKTMMTNRYVNKVVWQYYSVFSEFLAWKILDFSVIRKGNAENANKAFQTSFGRIGASEDLFTEYGIFIKRQNGAAIQEVEVDDIDKSLQMAFKTFGDFANLLAKHRTVISHANLTHMYARKAIGIFVPNIPAIGISRIGGIRQFFSTASHEFAHFLDYYNGNVGWYNSMNYESLEGKIASVFRSFMQNRSSASEYFKSTVECFARAIQQYFTMKWFPDNEFGHYSMINIERPRIITETPYYCNQSDFETHVKPIIEEWVKQNGLPEYKSAVDMPSDSKSAAQAQRIRILKLKYKYQTT